jgi:diaminopimelate decarboxylase
MITQPMTEGPWSARTAFGPDGLAVAGAGAVELAERFGTPLVAVDEADIRARCRAFRDPFDHALWAVKAFPLQGLVRIAAGEGLGLLAATGGELDTCLRAGIDPGAVVLHGNNKLDQEIEAAVDAGIGTMILDSEEDAERVAATAARAGRVQPALLRVVPGVEVDTHEYVQTGARDTKFGTPLAGGLALRALSRAMAAPQLDLRGIHVHVGSQLLDVDPYLREVEVVLAFLAEARESVGFEAGVLDVGGGMGVRYTDEEPIGPADLGPRIREALDRGCRARGLPVPEVWVEPGRAITSGSALTLYRVGAVKEVPGTRTYVAVDGGMSDNIRPALYGSRYAVAPASRPSDAPTRPVTVVGRHCESGDVLARDVPLPADVRRGDLLAFASTGAYEYAMASTYNKVGRPAVALVRDGDTRLIARRETLEDLARLDVEPTHG